MSRSEILRVWGKADSFDIEFSKTGGLWVCAVPPDTKDGQYAVEVHAINEFEQTAYWTGTLYMCNGICHLELKETPYVIMFLSEPEMLRFFEPTHEIIIKKGCEHANAWKH